MGDAPTYLLASRINNALGTQHRSESLVHPLCITETTKSKYIESWRWLHSSEISEPYLPTTGAALLLFAERSAPRDYGQRTLNNTTTTTNGEQILFISLQRTLRKVVRVTSADRRARLTLGPETLKRPGLRDRDALNPSATRKLKVWRSQV